MKKTHIIIAIDGVSASGKGSVAKIIADKLNLAYLDTGKIYRAVAYYMLNKNIDNKDTNSIVEIAKNLKIENLEKLPLESENIAKVASVIAKFPEIRKALLCKQQEFAYKPCKQNGTILDGRDIGTAICKDADVKFFLTASLEARAGRRFAQKKDDSNLEEICTLIQQRDNSDKALNDLAKNSSDCIVIDNTNLTLEQTANLFLDHIKLNIK